MKIFRIVALFRQNINFNIQILLFIFCRFFMVLLPGILLYRLGSIWLKHRTAKR